MRRLSGQQGQYNLIQKDVHFFINLINIKTLRIKFVILNHLHFKINED